MSDSELKTNQIARFYVQLNDVDKQPENVGWALAFLHLVPTKVEFLFDQRAFLYTAICDGFDEVEPDEEPPFVGLKVFFSEACNPVSAQIKDGGRFLEILPDFARIKPESVAIPTGTVRPAAF